MNSRTYEFFLNLLGSLFGVAIFFSAGFFVGWFLWRRRTNGEGNNGAIASAEPGDTV